MIFVVEAIGLRRWGRFCQRTAPLVASTTIAEAAATLGLPLRGGTGVERRATLVGRAAAGSLRGSAGGFGAATAGSGWVRKCSTPQ